MDFSHKIQIIAVTTGLSICLWAIVMDFIAIFKYSEKIKAQNEADKKEALEECHDRG